MPQDNDKAAEIIHRKVDKLHTDNVFTIPIDVEDWAKLLGEDAEGWRMVWPSSHIDEEGVPIEISDVYECERCLSRWGDDLEPGSRRFCPDCDGECERVIEGLDPACYEPMMNYHYPVDLVAEDGRTLDVELIATKVRAAGSTALLEWANGSFSIVLTGGGMDLSWDICRAYIACGQLPPFHFCDLPVLADSEHDLLTLEACKQSCTVVVNTGSNHLSQLIWDFHNSRIKNEAKRGE